MASFMFLPVLDYFSEISSPKATKSRAVGPSPRMTFLFTETYIKKVKKGHEITGRMPVKYDRRAEGPCTCVDGVNISSPKATKSRAVGPFTTNDGPKARLCKFRRRRR